MVARWDTKGIIVTQVRPTDSAINYEEKKQIRTKKINQFFLSYRGSLYRTKDYILVTCIQTLHTNIILCVVRSAVKELFQWLCFRIQATGIEVVSRVFFNHSCHL